MEMEDNYTLITFKYRSGWFQKEETIPWHGTLAEFVVNRIQMGGPMPVVIHAESLSGGGFEKVWHYYIENKCYSKK